MPGKFWLFCVLNSLKHCFHDFAGLVHGHSFVSHQSFLDELIFALLKVWGLEPVWLQNSSGYGTLSNEFRYKDWNIEKWQTVRYKDWFSSHMLNQSLEKLFKNWILFTRTSPFWLYPKMLLINSFRISCFSMKKRWLSSPESSLTWFCSLICFGWRFRFQLAKETFLWY